MKLDHLAIWVEDLELQRQFYIKYFNVTCNKLYSNPNKNYTSYFLSFGVDKSRIELMSIPNMLDPIYKGHVKGLSHFAICLGSKDAVNALTERLRLDGYAIASEPRTSGDGYYESVVLDPEGNAIELIG